MLNGFVLIETQTQFYHLCRKLQTAKLIALDSEFIREKTFYPIFALLQVAVPVEQTVYLIDIPRIPDISAWRQVFLAKELTCIMHGCSEDLELFWHTWHCLPVRLFDTQIAQALSGGPQQMGYSKLVEQRCGVRLSDGQTRSDWLKRPLTADQLEYAANDVRYLETLYDQLVTELVSLKRKAWLFEEVEQLKRKTNQRPALEKAYLKVHNHWTLTPVELQRLSHLCRWREEHARHCNVPRRNIAVDAVLLQLALVPTLDTLQHMVQEKMFSVAQLNDYSSSILNSLDSGVEEGALVDALPVSKPLSKPLRQLVKQLKGRIANTADALAIEPDCILKKRQLVILIRLVGTAVQATPELLKRHNSKQQPLSLLLEESLPSWALGWRRVVCIEIVLSDILLWYLNR